MVILVEREDRLPFLMVQEAGLFRTSETFRDSSLIMVTPKIQIIIWGLSRLLDFKGYLLDILLLYSF